MTSSRGESPRHVRSAGRDALEGEAAKRRTGRRRPKADALPSDATSVLGEVAAAGEGRRWAVAAMPSLLDEDMADWAEALAVMADASGIAKRGQVLDEVAEALMGRSWALSWTLWRRGATPVFLNGAARLTDDVPADFGDDVSRLMRRRNQPNAGELWAEGAKHDLRPYDALRVIAYYLDAVCDDVALLASTERSDVIVALWGATYDVDT